MFSKRRSNGRGFLYGVGRHTRVWGTPDGRLCVSEGFRISRHQIVREEPTQIVIEHLSRSEKPRFPDRQVEPLLVDRRELDTRGYSLPKSAAGSSSWFFACRTRAAVRDAIDYMRAELLKGFPPEPVKFDDDSAPADIKVAHYAEVVKGMRGVTSQAHRGVWDLEDGSLVIFGNDGSPEDRRFEHAVDLLRRRMTEAHLAEELGYAVSQDGWSWAMLVRRPDGEPSDEDLADSLHTMLWEAWFDACQIARL